MMRKGILLVLLLFVFFTLPDRTFAFGIDVNINRTIPGVNCGVPNLQSNPDAAKCCYYKPIESISKVPWIIEKMGGIGLLPLLPNPFKAWNNARESVLKTQDKYASMKPCWAGIPTPLSIPASDPSCRCEIPPENVRSSIVTLCRERFDPAKRGEGVTLSSAELARLDREMNQCIACAEDNGYYSAIGCFKFSVTDFITRWVFGFGVSLAGLLALACIIVGALKVQLSQGQAETVQQSREMIVSCLLGLILIIFSVFLLNFVGITILPGLFF